MELKLYPVKGYKYVRRVLIVPFMELKQFRTLIGDLLQAGS